MPEEIDRSSITTDQRSLLSDFTTIPYHVDHFYASKSSRTTWLLPERLHIQQTRMLRYFPLYVYRLLKPIEARSSQETMREGVFIDGPIILQPADLMGAASTTSLGSEEGAEARGWFKWNASKNEAEGLAESLVMIRDLLKSQRFDGVFGFSQGAGMAGLLSAMLERPESYPPFLIYGQPPHPPFKFCVAVSGFRLNGAIGDSVFATTYKTPTLHVIGKTDIIVVEERSRKLVDLNESPRVEEHDGGHFVPSKGNWRKFLAAYLLDPTGDVPSPSAFSSSGTATPVEGLAMKL
ncbi:unnamed protein product [Mycena citricolor]|uniref:Serine hydrolase domain-containing protein n=1 Tax=Mycena citricolor TaxID=2018698 RepID=A0AAD2GUF6_9AGAR|nr:unnamed protein product [Mycena citricolor]